MAYTNFQSIIYELEGMGVYDVVLPFLLIFIILFAILEKTMIFGHTGAKGSEKPKTNINVIFALLVSAIVIIDPHQNLINLIRTYLPGVSLVIVIGIFFMIIAAMFSKDGWTGLPFWAGGAIAIFAVIWSLSDPHYGAGWDFLYQINPQAFSIIIVVGIIGFIIWGVTKSNSGTGGTS